MLDEQQFKNASDAAIEKLNRALALAADRFDFEADMNGGALVIEFEEPKAKFVVSPNSPVRQIWVSAHSRSFKLDWNVPAEAFVLGGTGQTLNQLLAEQITQQIGEEVAL